MNIQTSCIDVCDKQGNFHTIECRTTTQESPYPAVAIINGPEKFFLGEHELKKIGEGRYETPDGQLLVEIEET